MGTKNNIDHLADNLLISYDNLHGVSNTLIEQSLHSNITISYSHGKSLNHGKLYLNSYGHTENKLAIGSGAKFLRFLET